MGVVCARVCQGEGLEGPSGRDRTSDGMGGSCVQGCVRVRV